MVPKSFGSGLHFRHVPSVYVWLRSTWEGKQILNLRFRMDMCYAGIGLMEKWITTLEDRYSNEQLRFGGGYPNMFAIRPGTHVCYDRLEKTLHPSSL